MSYDVIIGLEVHVQLQTQTKIFCGCSTAFNPDHPNVQTCPVCLGLPGALPVLNGKAFHLAVKTALGLNCQIASFTKWDRKQYFYPDLPKGYQISQYDLPFSHDGLVDVIVEELGGSGQRSAISGQESGVRGQETGVRGQGSGVSSQKSDVVTAAQSSHQSHQSHASHQSHSGTSHPKPFTRRVRILRAHMEEDAGKNMHDESGRGRDSMVDLNRAGTPLVEIVTEPDLRSAEEARRFLEELKLLLTYLEVSDCNMQEGSLRCDANVNLHVHQPDGSKVATPIVEVKNLNSFRFTEQAIQFEVARQWDLFQKTGIKLGDKGGHKATRGYNPDRGETYVLREKEEAADYRYFPDPDLVPVLMDDAKLAGIRSEMCEPPAPRRERFQTEYQLTPYDAAVIIDQGRLFADYFESVARSCGDGKQAANWITQDVLREMKQRDQSISDFAIRPEVLGALLDRINRKQITIKSAREVFGELLAGSAQNEADSGIPGPNRIDEIIAAKGLAIVQDTGAIDAAIATVLGRNAKAVADFKSGNEKAIGALIGQVMREVKGADPQTVREKIIAAMR
jgi:aspartyl-tRNA(Asn)/glutamyl-tRNA(Gln) amidotransferase subunit B